MTVRLQPCGQARARFVGPDGKPIAKLDTAAYIELLMTPGSPQFAQRQDGKEPVGGRRDLHGQRRSQALRERRAPVTDSEGRITLPDLIPGALYRISDYSTINDQKGLQVRKDFTVKPGETLDLGDILIERPGS